jgi:hypothetical protein
VAATIQIELLAASGELVVFTGQCDEIPTDPPEVMYVRLVSCEGMVTSFDPEPGYDRFKLDKDGVYRREAYTEN